MTPDIKARIEEALTSHMVDYQIIPGSWVDAKRSVPVMKAQELQDLIKDLAAENKQQDDLLKQLACYNHDAQAKIIALEAESQRYKDALEFYADENNYDDNCAPFKMVTSHECVHEFIERDLGKIAKAALHLVHFKKEGWSGWFFDNELRLTK